MSAPNVDVVNHPAPLAQGPDAHGDPHVVPGAEAAAVSAALPESKLYRSDFGFLEGKFQYSTELKTFYADSARMIASQIRAYEKNSPGAELTDGQKKFLKLYDKNPEGILDTAEGWMATHVALEHEMFIRGAIVDEDLQLLVKEKGKQPHDNDEVELSKDEWERGFLNKYGPKAAKIFGIIVTSPVSLPFIGAIKAWDSAVKHDARVIKLKLKTQYVDISRLSEQERKYIDYLKRGANKENIGAFLLHAGKSQQEFYKQLGIDISKSGGPGSSWRTLDRAATVEGAAQNLGTEWENYRLAQVQKILDEDPAYGGVFPSAAIDGARRAELYSRAQQRTLEHFASLALAKTVEKGATHAAEASSSITVMEKRAKDLTSPQKAQELREKKKAELTQTETKKTEAETAIKSSQTKIDELTNEIDKATQNTATYQARITSINTVDISALNGQITTIEGLRSTAENTLNGQIVALPADKQAAAEVAKNQTLQKYTDQIERVKAQIAALKEEEKTLQDALNKINADKAERSLEERKLKRKKKEKGALEKEIDQLKKDIEQPVATMAVKKAEQLEMTAASLKRHSEIVADALGGENDINLQTLSDQTLADQKDHRFNAPFEVGKQKGYLTLLDHLFQYSKQPDPKNAFATAQRILPPDAVVTLIIDYLEVAPPPANLSAALQALRDKNIPPSRLSSFFANIMEHIEQRGLRTA